MTRQGKFQMMASNAKVWLGGIFIREENEIVLLSILIFVVAGLAEIGGGYLVWLWLRESKPLWYGIVGSIILILYGIIPTLQSFPSFGRVYAAYGGVFIILAVLWGWVIDKKTPDLYDWTGAVVCVIGVSIMLWAPRG